MWGDGCELNLWWSLYLNIHMYQIIMLYTLNWYSVICQLSLDNWEKKATSADMGCPERG